MPAGIEPKTTCSRGNSAIHCTTGLHSHFTGQLLEGPCRSFDKAEVLTKPNSSPTVVLHFISAFHESAKGNDDVDDNDDNDIDDDNGDNDDDDDSNLQGYKFSS